MRNKYSGGFCKIEQCEDGINWIEIPHSDDYPGSYPFANKKQLTHIQQHFKYLSTQSQYPRRLVITLQSHINY